MALTWTGAEIIAKARKLSGRPSTGQISASDFLDKVNDFYQNRFPFEADVDEFRDWMTQELTATDSGEYSVAATVLGLLKPVYVNGEEVTLLQDRQEFFAKHPKDTGSAFVISDAGAGLAIGTSSTSAVKNGNAFKYNISGDGYSKAADAETELSGGTIPQNKYGAWRLEIDTDGTISIVQAARNAGDKVIGSDLNEYECILAHTASSGNRPVTGASYATYWSATGNTGSSETWSSGTDYASGVGYDTPGLAVQGLTNESSSKACMGYVTAMSTDSGGFVPGTTSLSDSAVTATYTDGFSGTRNVPEDVLLYKQTLYVGPKSNDLRELKAPYIKKPTALATNTCPTDVRWGPAIAYGTAIEILTEGGNKDRADSLRSEYERLLNQITMKYRRQFQEKVVKRSF